MEHNDRFIKRDRMRYTKDSCASNLVLLAIVFNVLYFIGVYKTDVENYYYTWVIGASVIYNLLFLLISFLASQVVKSRKDDYWLVLIVLGAMQIVRIFYLPTKAHSTLVDMGGGIMQLAMSDGLYYSSIVCLVASAVCCALAGVINLINCRNLAQHMRELENKTA